MRYYTQLGVDSSIGSRSSSFWIRLLHISIRSYHCHSKICLEIMLPMSNRQKRRSDQEWLVLFQECRTSGMTDKDWCEMNDSSVSSFYNKICKLRKKNYDILIVTKTSTRSVQDAVSLEIVDEPSSTYECRNSIDSQLTEFVPAVVIHAKNLRIQISNDVAKTWWMQFQHY